MKWLRCFPHVLFIWEVTKRFVEQNWTKCTRCQALKKELGYEKSSQLMVPFFTKMLDFVRNNGKEPILWCELDRIYPPAYRLPVSISKRCDLG